MQRSDYSYDKCRVGYYRCDGYIASRSDGGTISLRTLECEQLLSREPNPLGWKFHISIDDERENMIRAWDNLAPIFVRQGVNFIKFIRPDAHQDDKHSESERGRQFTIYIEQNPEKTKDDWQRLINEITDTLVRENIRPGYRNVVAKAVPGSSYFYYRNDIPPPEAAHDERSSTPKAAHEEGSLPRETAHDDESPTPEAAHDEGSSSLEASHDEPPTPEAAHDKASPQLLEKNTAEESHTSKPAAVPSLKLHGFTPSWTKRDVGRAKDIFVDDKIKIKYNPSNADERFLPELKVENNNQLEPKGFSETNRLKSSK